MGDLEEQVCNPDCKLISILHNQTFFDKQKSKELMFHIKEVKKL